jgi:peptidyl-dipeptidase A
MGHTSTIASCAALASALALGPIACKSREKAAASDDAPTVAKADERDAAVPGKGPMEVVNGEGAKAFVTETDARLRELWTVSAQAEWAKATNITDETEAVAAKATAAVMEYETQAIKEASKWVGVQADPDVLRQIELLRLTSTLPAPDDAAARKELAEISAKLEALYGKGKFCTKHEKGGAQRERCRDLGELSDVMATSRDPAELLEAWNGWRTISAPMRPLYERLVQLGNAGARDIGFADVGELWRSRYDMTPVAFEQEIERLWSQVQPLYEQLHCHVRGRLSEKYGESVVPPRGPIPAHLLGNMWAQDWSNLYPLLEPHPGEPSLDVTRALRKKGYGHIEMVKLGEKFFTSLGLDALPETFWERSMFTKPPDRDVVCHASAWDVTLSNDLRIKMCIKIDHEDLVTIHHELGHNYYYNYYHTLPVLFQAGAHDGFHEAIGDAIALSITPAYLKDVGLLDEVSKSEQGVINEQMQDALAKIAFLPFGKLIDQWRWDVFAGRTTPENYNAAWWALRETVQGVAAPIERTEEAFDPGAKYHIPSNTPYARYFLAHVLQFQFHKALCEASGHDGPLHTCSIYGSEAAGEKLRAMLALGASKPWPDALQVLTGRREMDAAPLVEYFEPLMGYLQAQNEGRTCGW